MSRQALIPAVFPYSDPSTRTFSLGITALGSVWVSGSTAARLDRASGKTRVEGNLAEQARLILEKTRVVLEAGGLGLADIVSMVQYLTPAALAELPQLSALYKEVFAGTPPLVNTIVVNSLLRGRALIEIESVAGRGAGLALEYLPAVSGADRAQARVRAEELLQARGLAWDDVVKSTELMSGAEFARPGGAPRSGLQIVMPRVYDDDAGAQILMTASRGQQGQVLYLSAEGDPAAGGVAAQCREIYARLGKLLVSAGSGLESVVKTTEFVTPVGLADYRQTADVRREVFAAPYPAATGVICDRLVHPAAQLAVEIVAVRNPA